MKKKWIVGFMMALCLTTCSACSLPFELPFDVPFLNTSDAVSISGQEEVKVATVEQTADDMVAIRVLEETDAKLVDVMESLQADGLMTFTKDSQGMVTAVNGKENPSDWSACWMLYTSDTEFASTEWGGYEYKGETLGSAVFGVDTLPVKKGEVYIWAYTSF